METLLLIALRALLFYGFGFVFTFCAAAYEVEDRKRSSWAWVCCFVAALLTYAAQIGAFSGDGPEM